MSGKFYKSTTIQNSTNINLQNVDSLKNCINLNKKNENNKIDEDKKIDTNFKLKTNDLFTFSNKNQIENKTDENVAETFFDENLESDEWNDDFFDASDSFDTPQNVLNKKENFKVQFFLYIN